MPMIAVRGGSVVPLEVLVRVLSLYVSSEHRESL